MTGSDLPPLASAGFDRDASTRLSTSALDAAWAERTTVLLRLKRAMLPLRELDGDRAELELVPVSGERESQHWYLGRAEGRAVFAAAAHDGDGYPEPSAVWRPTFTVGALLRPVQRELVTVAQALHNWHASMPFSPQDGEPTETTQGGWARLDPHGREHFPRTDPAVIVLVEHEGRLLLGSNVLWEADRFSLLAGFVEAGESAEQAVAREIHEEAGIRVEDIRYVASQSWPFPRSLMLGFRARLAHGEDPGALAPDPTEISALRWFTREELRTPAPGLLLPGSISIARWLIDRWAAEPDAPPRSAPGAPAGGSR